MVLRGLQKLQLARIQAPSARICRSLCPQRPPVPFTVPEAHDQKVSILTQRQAYERAGEAVHGWLQDPRLRDEHGNEDPAMPCKLQRRTLPAAQCPELQDVRAELFKELKECETLLEETKGAAFLEAIGCNPPQDECGQAVHR